MVELCQPLLRIKFSRGFVLAVYGFTCLAESGKMISETKRLAVQQRAYATPLATTDGLVSIWGPSVFLEN